MNLKITGHHIEVTPAIREYVTSKIDRIARHFDQVIGTHVILSVQKLEQKAEITLHVSGHDFFAESVSENLYAAIDAMTDKLDRQVIKHKEKLGNHARDPIKRQEPEPQEP